MKSFASIVLLVGISAFSCAESAKTMYEKSILLFENAVFDLDFCISELVRTEKYFRDETIDCNKLLLETSDVIRSITLFEVKEIRSQHTKDLKQASKLEALQLEDLQQYYGYLIGQQLIV